MNKYDKYNELKVVLERQGVMVGAFQEINFGLQFDAMRNGKSSKVRVYESKKKGITVDLSQVKYDELRELIDNINTNGVIHRKIEEDKSTVANVKDKGFMSDKIDVPLIGVDESGKGDYFGPLVIAGVFADKKEKLLLEALGAMDSKAVNDKQIRTLAKQIRQICVCETVIIGNESYNKIYERVANLNKLLAWGHARVIENLLGRVECGCALSDQFGNESLIKSALMERGKEILLEQRPRAEENIVVAAASIIARDEFVRKIEQMEDEYKQQFPKGASVATINAGTRFVKTYGRERLNEVSKLHFKTTQNI